MRRIFIFTLFSTISSLLSAMQAPEAIQANDEAAYNWATQLCTESFLGKVTSNFSKLAMMDLEEDERWSLSSNLRFGTQGPDEEEDKLLKQLVEHNEWSKQLYQKIAESSEPYYVEKIYEQIIHWAFGRTSLGFNTVPRFAWERSQSKFSLKHLPQFMVEHVNLYRKNGTPFLFKMLKTPDVGLVSDLIKIGANPNARCARTGNSALHELSRIRYRYYNEHFEVKDKIAQQYYREFITLLTKHIAINVRNDLGQTPLHQAIGNMNFMKVLLERKKIKINAQDKNGNTALHEAAYFFEAREYERWHDNHNLLIERKNDRFGTLLLLYGADSKIRNNVGLCYNDIIDAKREEFRQQKQWERDRWLYGRLSDYPY